MASLMKDNNAENVVEYLMNCHANFELVSSNYTTKIKSEQFTKTFVLTMQSLRTFSAFQKLKADLIKFEIPNITQDQVRYFEHDFRKDFAADEVINIDLKSAYATVLYIDKMISEETYKYFGSCRKQERLASVGMLASRKKIFQFENGKPVSYREDINPLSGFFFYCVKRTQEIMADLQKICGNKYLFTWVDGIYFLRDETVIGHCAAYLQSIGFPFSLDTLNRFKVSINDRNVFASFYKGEKLKTFCLPSTSTEFKKVVMESIILINKTKQNEKSKVASSNEFIG